MEEIVRNRDYRVKTAILGGRLRETTKFERTGMGETTSERRNWLIEGLIWRIRGLLWAHSHIASFSFALQGAFGCSLMLEHDPNMRFRIDRPRSYPFSRQTRSNTLPSRSSLLADASYRTAVDVLGSQMDYDSSRKEAEEREEVYCHVSQTVSRES